MIKFGKRPMPQNGTDGGPIRVLTPRASESSMKGLEMLLAQAEQTSQEVPSAVGTNQQAPAPASPPVTKIDPVEKEQEYARPKPLLPHKVKEL